MTAAAFLVALVAGPGIAWAVAARRARRRPVRLLRVNVSGREVPAVLGDGVVAGMAAGVLAAAVAGVFNDRADLVEIAGAVALAGAALWAAGRSDDLRGDERDRGFKGHIAAALAGRITGGLVKLLAGAAGGLAAAALVVDSATDIALTGALVALAANLFNLLDRAPGRALKLWLVVAIPVFVAAPDGWAVASAGLLGAALGLLPTDLGERAMLGDAGANPLGAVWGLGLALSLATPWRVAAVVVLVGLNLASERWSFSRVIEATPGLREFDRLGRK